MEKTKPTHTEIITPARPSILKTQSKIINSIGKRTSGFKLKLLAKALLIPSAICGL